MLADTFSFFFPLSDSQAKKLTGGALSSLENLADMSLPELAAVSVIQQIPLMTNAGKSAASFERLLSQVITTSNEIDVQSGAGTFAKIVAARFDSSLFGSGVERLPSIGARLMDDKALAERAYLKADGSWDFGFSSRYRSILDPFTEEFVTPGFEPFLLTDSQARTFRIFMGELDENLHLQALAGTGKTFLIERMVDLLSAYKPLILAMTKAQVDVVLRRVGPHRSTGLTFGEFASRMLQQDISCPSRLRWHSTNRAKVDLQVVASELHILQIGDMSAPQVASVAMAMVSRYCYSADIHITEDHIPNVGEKLTDIERAALVEYARRIWAEVREPRYLPDKLPVFYYHRQKQLSLAVDPPAPQGYTHIIIDEAHDLPIPLQQYLARTGLPVITLADACQRLDGKVSRPFENVRSREIYQSVRAGRQIETAINTLINQNPIVRVHPLEGSRVRDTRTIFYDGLDIPSDPTTILVDSEWGLFEYCQRLSAKKAPFALLPGAVNDFDKFVKSCIRLYRDNIRPSYGSLFRYRSWEELRIAKGQSDPAFCRVDRMLQKGYTERDFDHLLLSQVSLDAARYFVGRVVDAKNMEVDSVMLTPDLLRSSGGRSRTEVAKRFAALYTGGTRARYRLYVPGHLRDWAAEQAAKAIDDN